MACVESFNKHVTNGWDSIGGQRLCLPHTCKVAIVEDSLISVGDYVKNSKGFTLHQFLEWNKCVNQGSLLRRNDPVCVGPRNGLYTPSVVPVATSSTYPSTA